MKRAPSLLPTTAARLVGPRQRQLLRVRCPWCHQVHFHAQPAGKRNAHCGSGRQYLVELEAEGVT